MVDVPVIVQPVPDEVGVADSDGVAISWKRFGDGPQSVLFVPTWNLVDSRTLRHQVEALRDSFRVITYDARGSGESGCPPAGYGFDLHADDAVAVMKATGTTSSGVVTASRGASVSILLAALHPDMVERLVMIAPALNVEREPPEDSAAFWVERDRYEGWEHYSAPAWRADFPGFLKWFMAEVFSEPDSEETIDEVTAVALDADSEMLIVQDSEQDWNQAVTHIPQVRCPALVIQGGDDRAQDPATARALVAALPSARLVWLERLGHRPDIRRPDLVNPVLAELLDE